MNKRRLLKLADLLEADANNPKGVKFDLSLWGRLTEIPDEIPDVIPVDCGTVACAVGLACLSGEFKRSGLTYSTDNEDGELGVNDFVPVFGNQTGQEAVEQFFSLNSAEFDFLFVVTEYPKRKQKGRAGELAVAKRIRDFVAGKAPV